MKEYDLSTIKTPFTITLIGIPLVGKSTFISGLFGADFEVISSDGIMMEMAGTQNYEDAFKAIGIEELDTEITKRVKAFAEDQKNVVFDITNTVRKRRLRNIGGYSRKIYTHIAVVFPTPSDAILQERNQVRVEKYNKFMSDEVLRMFAENYQPIRKDEDFDIIINL